MYIAHVLRNGASANTILTAITLPTRYQLSVCRRLMVFRFFSLLSSAGLTPACAVVTRWRLMEPKIEGTNQPGRGILAINAADSRPLKIEFRLKGEKEIEYRTKFSFPSHARSLHAEKWEKYFEANPSDRQNLSNVL